MNRLRFNLNGRWVEEPRLSPTTTLLRYLRDKAQLTGTKEGCAEGDCGACTVAIAEAGLDGQPQWRAVNACLVLLPRVQGKTVLTVEALRDAGSGHYHPAQEAMAKALGSQCGYCTPGIVMSLFEATYRKDLKPESWKLDDQLCGNLCRCTGYRPIRAAAAEVAGSCPKDRFAEGLEKAAPQSMELKLEADGQKFFTPVRIGALWDLLDFSPDARFVVGGTDLSLEVTKKYSKPPLLVSLEGIPELKKLEDVEGGYRLGATATISELEQWSESRLPSLARMTRYFGARQIKHRGTLGGNLCTASPIGDLAPALISLGGTAVILSRAGERRVPLDEFFLSYRKTALQPKELLAAVEVPRLDPKTVRALSYKVSKRRELDISTVAAGLLVQLGEGDVVTKAVFAFGGMAATPKRAAKTEGALVGQRWSAAAVEAALPKLQEDFTPLNDHRGSAAYRAKVAANLLRGFFEETQVVPQPELMPRHTATIQTYEVTRG